MLAAASLAVSPGATLMSAEPPGLGAAVFFDAGFFLAAGVAVLIGFGAVRLTATCFADFFAAGLAPFFVDVRDLLAIALSPAAKRSRLSLSRQAHQERALRSILTMT